MIFLCSLTDWQTRLGKRGKLTGKPICERYILAYDKYNWIIANEKKHGRQEGLKFCKEFAQLLPYFWTYADDPLKRLSELTDLLSKKLHIGPPIPTQDLAIQLGEWIDNHYQCQTSNDCNIYKTLCGGK